MTKSQIWPYSPSRLDFTSRVGLTVSLSEITVEGRIYQLQARIANEPGEYATAAALWQLRYVIVSNKSYELPLKGPYLKDQIRKIGSQNKTEFDLELKIDNDQLNTPLTGHQKEELEAILEQLVKKSWSALFKLYARRILQSQSLQYHLGSENVRSRTVKMAYAKYLLAFAANSEQGVAKLAAHIYMNTTQGTLEDIVNWLPPADYIKAAKLALM